MTVLDYLQMYKNGCSIDIEDDRYPFTYTFDYPMKYEQAYDYFVVALAEKVNITSFVDDSCIRAEASFHSLIENHREEFTKFMVKNWQEHTHELPSSEEFVTVWLCELRALFAGAGTEGQYKIYYDFIRRLK